MPVVITSDPEVAREALDEKSGAYLTHDSEVEPISEQEDSDEKGGDNSADETSYSDSGRADHSILPKKVSIVAQKTAHKAKKLVHKTEHAYTDSKWCSPMRYIGRFPRKWPRTSAFMFGVVLPLWLVIFISLGFGQLLATLEMDQETADNNAIIAARKTIEVVDLERLKLLDIPGECWRSYLETNEDVSNSTIASINGTEVGDFMKNCAASYIPRLEFINEVRDNSSLAFDSPSFNWNRCWNESMLSSKIVFHPTEEHIIASRPENQEQSFILEWERQYDILLERYLPTNATEDELTEALQRAIEEASGGDSCKANRAGTAWFFFTIMTTVGYGNQAPSTSEGRMLIYSAGFISLILFGAILGSSGYILLSIYDDCVSRFSCSKFLRRPIVGVVLWGGIWLAWAVVIAGGTEWWWAYRLPEFDADHYDALWFAYISTSTIGLGDYYLQPEVMFPSDALKFSVSFLVGFVFLSTFIGKIVETVNSILPTRENSLENVLRSTRVLACWPRGTFFKSELFCLREEVPNEHDKDGFACQQQRIEDLCQLLPDSDTAESNPLNMPLDDLDPALLEREEQLLKQLLEMVQDKKNGFEITSGGNFYPALVSDLGSDPSAGGTALIKIPEDQVITREEVERQAEPPILEMDFTGRPIGSS